MLLMDQSLLIIVTSTVEVELIGKKLVMVNRIVLIVIVFCLTMMELQWMEFEFEQMVWHQQ